jgi:hypothetical protein
MTGRQSIFIREYLKEQNAAKAAIAAGYSQATAATQARRLLRNVVIKAAIDKARQAAIGRVCRTRDEWLKGLDKLCAHPDPVISLKAHEQLGKAQGFNEPDKADVTHHLADLSDADLEAIAGAKA